MKRALSDRLLHSLAQPREHPEEVWDQLLPGFGCRVSKQGTVAFCVMKRPYGQRKLVRLTLGRYPALSLAKARARARDTLRELQDGVDPRVRKAEDARTAAAKQANTFAAVAETFIIRHVASKRTAHAIEQLIRRELIPRWGQRPITDITRADVIALVDEIVDRGHPEAARLVFAYARRLFGWAVPRYGLEHAPTDHLSPKDLIGAKSFRRRVLNEREIALLWRATEGPEAYGPYARLLLLLGIRRSELGRAIWLEFDLDNATWIIPPGRMKSDEPHVVPLAPVAVEILRSLLTPNARATSYVIGGAPIHYSRAKRWLDAAMTALNGGKAIPRWTWHDARRTFRTGLSGLKIAPHIAELAIAHGKQGLNRIYDQHEYDAELRYAFEAWAQRVMTIVTPLPDKVVPLRKGT